MKMWNKFLRVSTSGVSYLSLWVSSSNEICMLSYIYYCRLQFSVWVNPPWQMWKLSKCSLNWFWWRMQTLHLTDVSRQNSKQRGLTGLVRNVRETNCYDFRVFDFLLVNQLSIFISYPPNKNRAHSVLNSKYKSNNSVVLLSSLKVTLKCGGSL